MKPEWIVVGDRGRALIFARTPGASLPNLVEAIANPRAMGVGEEARVAASAFARDLADHLEKCHRLNRFSMLSLILPPGMLEAVRDALRGATARSLRSAIAEDLGQWETPVLLQRIATLRPQASS